MCNQIDKNTLWTKLIYYIDAQRRDYNDENEELLIIPHSQFKINVAQYIYEAIVLAVPIKKIHPGVIDGTLQSDILEKLKEFEINSFEEDQTEEETNREIDPRWNKLKEYTNRKK